LASFNKVKKFMSELNQILEYEEQKKEEITQARRAAQEAIQKKQEQLRKKLFANADLTAGESQEIVQKTKARIKELEDFYQKRQKDELDSLSRQKSVKLEQAVDLIVADFQSLII